MDERACLRETDWGREDAAGKPQSERRPSRGQGAARTEAGKKRCADKRTRTAARFFVPPAAGDLFSPERQPDEDEGTAVAEKKSEKGIEMAAGKYPTDMRTTVNKNLQEVDERRNIRERGRLT
jgi:hypothetical protein